MWKELGPIEYAPTTALWGLYAMSRGRCAICKEPVLEKCERLIAPFAMIPCELLKIEPDVNIYYGSGLKKGNNGLKTVYSDLGSLLFEIFLIVVKGLPTLPTSLLVLMLGQKSFKKE